MPRTAKGGGSDQRGRYRYACYSSEWLTIGTWFSLVWELILIDMRTVQRNVLMLSVAALVVLLLGCSSSDPSTSQGPPETPEAKPPATGAAGGEQGAQGEGNGGQSGTGGGGGQGGAEGSGGSSDASERDGASAEGLAGPQGGAQSGGQPPAGSPATGDEAASALDQELDGALGEFDRQMREEMERLAEETANAEREGSRAAGGGSGSDSSGGSANESKPSDGGSTEEGGDSSGAVGGSGPGATGSDRVPDDVGDGSDDDIVARQLREAAMTEEDPELREKLWEEYRRYKESIGGSKKDGK